MRADAEVNRVEPIRPTLAVVPVSLATTSDLDDVVRCLVSLWSTTENVYAIVVDDASPDPGLVDQLEVAAAELGYDVERLVAPAGRAAAVNAGLAIAHQVGGDALVCDPNLDFRWEGWLDRMRERTDSQGRPAAVVGARLLYPNGVIAHAGMLFSQLRREFFNRFRFGPADLPEALRPTRCPVTHSLQLIRHETLASIGLYDESLDLGYEGTDYCLRAFAAGLEVIYEPAAIAAHAGEMPHQPSAESEEASLDTRRRFFAKHSPRGLGEWVPEVMA
ncbi:MAG: hypothetical protein AVDCRST_MAG30-3369 [uncultured Solirubrobacteraceae bacterium]|uniref:Glycosyltransferase 2-like domain-containing protein n=1 Tax=uncultured Solirubrobacteraceae bacterium TaxID=1162706 RepID=A0A6J4TLW3_9ACTN|nr:MAG: hypothetical protein AVDCRST_MAG30-3369 [uncultured Solirubrobacteraceae bacterium]